MPRPRGRLSNGVSLLSPLVTAVRLPQPVVDAPPPHRRDGGRGPCARQARTIPELPAGVGEVLQIAPPVQGGRLIAARFVPIFLAWSTSRRRQWSGGQPARARSRAPSIPAAPCA